MREGGEKGGLGLMESGSEAAGPGRDRAAWGADTGAERQTECRDGCRGEGWSWSGWRRGGGIGAGSSRRFRRTRCTLCVFGGGEFWWIKVQGIAGGL